MLLEDHGLIVTTGPRAGVQCLRYLAGQVAVVTVKAHRLEKRLVVVASQRGGFILLQESAFASSRPTAADLERHGLRLRHNWGVTSASTVSGGNGGAVLHWAIISGILRMVIKHHRSGNHAGAERRGNLLLVADAPALGAVFRGKTGGLKHSRVMPVVLRNKCTRLFLGQGDAAASLGVQAVPSVTTSSVRPPACLSSAFFSTSGSSFPRAEALRSIPRHAFGLK